MYEITVTTVISASHHLRGYEGMCENVHGHNYRVEASVKADNLNEQGLALDFKELKKHLREIAQDYDHHDLNQLEDFLTINPSSENIARVIYRRLAQRINQTGISMHKVRVYETEGSCITYREDR